MDDLEAYRIENKHPVYGVQSRENGLKYFYDEERRGIVIAGMRGKTGLDIRQAKALCKELPGILRDMGVHVKLQPVWDLERFKEALKDGKGD